MPLMWCILITIKMTILPVMVHYIGLNKIYSNNSTCFFFGKGIRWLPDSLKLHRWLTFVTCLLFLSDSTALDCGLASFFLLGTPKRRQRKQQEAQPTSEEPEPHLLISGPGGLMGPGAGQALGVQGEQSRYDPVSERKTDLPESRHL